MGAGSGTDVALALSKGAKHIDAVEIDPRIQQIGAEKNLDKPYDDPRVTVHINDGRAFLERTDKPYDLILFALPDSLTLSPAPASCGWRATCSPSPSRPAQELLARRCVRDVQLLPRGVVGRRLGNTVAAAFGHDPCIDLSARRARRHRHRQDA